MEAPEGRFGEDTDLGERRSLGEGSGGSKGWYEQKGKEKKERKRAVDGLDEQRRKRAVCVWDHQRECPLFEFVKDFYCRAGGSWLS